MLKRDFLQQFNETKSAFTQIRDIANDGFTDTATKGVSRGSGLNGIFYDFYLVRQPVQPTSEPGETTTEKYRISRAEFGRILSKNIRGLQKLMRIELADAKNVRNPVLPEIQLTFQFRLAISLHDVGL